MHRNMTKEYSSRKRRIEICCQKLRRMKNILDFKGVSMALDPNMKSVQNLCEGIKLDGYRELSPVIGDLSEDVASVFSTCSESFQSTAYKDLNPLRDAFQKKHSKI